MEKLFLILHGWGSSSQRWDQVKAYLQNSGFMVLAPDLPGFGQTPPPEKAWSLDDYAQWVEEYCEKQKISQVFLLGHSFGGSIAVKFALKHPQIVKKLFLVAPALVRIKTLKKRIISRTAGFFSFLPNSTKKVIYKRFLRSDYPLKAGIMRDIFKKVVAEDLSNCLSEIKVPTIIIWGRSDNITPIRDAYLISEKIKGSKLIVIEGQGHDLNRKAPELLSEKILENIK